LKVAPKWLANLGEMSRHMNGIAVFLVVEESNQLLIDSCRASGVGMLRLNELDVLELVLEPLERQAVDASKKFQAALNDTRRALETKLDRQLNIVATQFGDLAELTQGMSDAKQSRYARDLERRERIWREWSDQLSAMLDEAAMTHKVADLQAIEELINEGPPEA